MDTVTLANQYLQECQYRGLAPATIGQYQWALNRLKAKNLQLPSRGAQLLPALMGDHLAPESRHDLVKCWRTFFGWCSRRYDFPNPMGQLDRLPKRRQVRRVLSASELSLVLEAARCPRDEALVLVVLDSGLRVGEVAALRRGALGDGWAVVQGKVGSRRVPVSNEMKFKLLQLGEGEHIWIGQRGPLTTYGIKQVYRRLFLRAGIGGPKLGAHTLRHTFATMYLRTGGGTRQLQDILGHNKIETTMIYVHLAGNDVAADHALHSPALTMGLLAGD